MTPIATATSSLAAIGVVIISTIAVTFGGFLCITIAAILAALLEDLANRTLRSPDYQPVSDGKPHPYGDSSDTNKVGGLAGIYAGMGYLMAGFVIYMQSKGNETVLSTTLSTVVLVVGVEIGLTVALAVGMGLIQLSKWLLKD